jgi:hypothetical protein
MQSNIAFLVIGKSGSLASIHRLFVFFCISSWRLCLQSVLIRGAINNQLWMESAGDLQNYLKPCFRNGAPLTLEVP